MAGASGRFMKAGPEQELGRGVGWVERRGQRSSGTTVFSKTLSPLETLSW